ncbi:MAG: HNH endonuclease [Bacteroidia bacterium]|nr:HNH endonuclease [Bacteroidia bacterium]
MYNVNTAGLQYGRMQLVNTKIHGRTGHTGGFSLW